MRRAMGLVTVLYVLGRLMPIVYAPPTPTPPPVEAKTMNIAGTAILFVAFLALTYILTKRGE